MFRGAIILATGFALGYGKALQDSQEIKDLLVQLLEELKRQTEEKVETAEKTEGKTQADVDAEAEEVVEPQPVPPHPDKDAPAGE